MSGRSLSRASWVAFGAIYGVLYLVTSCGGDSSIEGSDSAPAASTTEAAAVTSAAFVPPEGNPELLSEWNQLEIRDGQLVMLDGVTPFALNTALFSDDAHKLRTVWMPDGAAAAVSDPDETFDFPVGTVITKTFYYPEPGGSADVLLAASDDSGLAGSLTLADVRLIETRVLVRRADGWDAMPYVWDDGETEASLARTGDVQTLAAVDDDGSATSLTYVVPDVNQCASCHATNHTSGGDSADRAKGSPPQPYGRLRQWSRISARLLADGRAADRRAGRDRDAERRRMG